MLARDTRRLFSVSCIVQVFTYKFTSQCIRGSNYAKSNSKINIMHENEFWCFKYSAMTIKAANDVQFDEQHQQRNLKMYSWPFSSPRWNFYLCLETVKDCPKTVKDWPGGQLKCEWIKTEVPGQILSKCLGREFEIGFILVIFGFFNIS